LHCAAYNLDEIDEKTKSFRESVKYTPTDGATALDVSVDIQISLLILAYN
jgi:hypothetical protein